MAKEKLTTHHILCQNPDTDTTIKGSSHKTNLIELPWTFHSWWHTVFINKMIADQLLTCVDLSSKALLPEVKNWLVETLTSLDPKDPELWYKPECFK